MSAIFISQLGDQGFTINLGSEINEQTNQRCITLAHHITNASFPGIIDVIPAYNTVSVIYNAVQVHNTHHTSTPSVYIKQQLHQLISTCKWEGNSESRSITVLACFHTSFAPDIELLAQAKRLTINQVIQKFTSSTYRVYMLGFLPGFAYMGKVEDDLAMPRKEKPHLNIIAGSIGIAGNQTGIYPLNSPGGWNIIGRTPLKLFNVSSNEPCLFRAGDMVTFQPISISEFHQLNQHQ